MFKLASLIWFLTGDLLPAAFDFVPLPPAPSVGKLSIAGFKMSLLTPAPPVNFA
jgi:hypothetical protein